MAENCYKVPNDVVEISNKIIDDTDDIQSRPYVLVQESEDTGFAGDWMYHGIRQYTSLPVLSKIMITSEKIREDKFDLSLYNVTDYQYFVCHNDEVLKKQVVDLGLKLLVETDNYCLYKNTKEFTVFFVRHGQTSANVANIYAGSGTDAMLTLTGIQQAEDTGTALSNVWFTDVYSSELTRATDTSSYILSKNLNEIPNNCTNQYLNDFYWGDIEGMTVDAVNEMYPDFNFDKYIGTSDDGAFISPIHTWSKCDTIYRYKRFFTLLSIQVQNGGNALVVGHSAMIWYFQQMFPDQVSEDAGLDNASITILHYDRGTWTLEYLNLSAEEYEELGL